MLCSSLFPAALSGFSLRRPQALRSKSLEATCLRVHLPATGPRNISATWGPKWSLSAAYKLGSLSLFSTALDCTHSSLKAEAGVIPAIAIAICRHPTSSSPCLVSRLLPHLDHLLSCLGPEEGSQHLQSHHFPTSLSQSKPEHVTLLRASLLPEGLFASLPGLRDPSWLTPDSSSVASFLAILGLVLHSPEAHGIHHGIAYARNVIITFLFLPPSHL